MLNDSVIIALQNVDAPENVGVKNAMLNDAVYVLNSAVCVDNGSIQHQDVIAANVSFVKSVSLHKMITLYAVVLFAYNTIRLPVGKN